MTPADWAIALAVAYGVGKLWDLLDPGAVNVKFAKNGSGAGRALVAIAAIVCIVAFIVSSLALSALATVTVILGIIALDAIGSLAKD